MCDQSLFWACAVAPIIDFITNTITTRPLKKPIRLVYCLRDILQLVVSSNSSHCSSSGPLKSAKATRTVIKSRNSPLICAALRSISRTPRWATDRGFLCVSAAKLVRRSPLCFKVVVSWLIDWLRFVNIHQDRQLLGLENAKLRSLHVVSAELNWPIFFELSDVYVTWVWVR